MENLQTINEFNPMYLPKGTTNFNINDNGFFESIHLEEPRAIIQTDEYLELIEQDDLELYNVHFKFSDNYWDFSSAKEEHENATIFRFQFSINSDFYKALLKVYVLNELLLGNLHRPYLYFDLHNDIDFLKYIERRLGNDLEELTDKEVKEYIDSLNISLLSKYKKKTSIKKILEFYGLISEKNIDENIFTYLEMRDHQKMKSILKANKLKLLPYSIIHPLIGLLEKEYKNEKNINRARYLALLYIASQCGIRPGELLILPYNCISSTKFHGKMLYQLHYLSTKDVRGKGYSSHITIANDKVDEAVCFLKKHVGKYDFLGKGLKTTLLNETLKSLINRNIELFNRKELDKYGYNGYPIVYQFRVYFATELRRRGFNDMYIAKLLGHNDEKMFGYYARAAETIQEDFEYSKHLITEVRHDDLKIMGTKGNIYEKRIKKFLEKGAIRVEMSEEEILMQILNELPIRQKNGGFCIKPNSSRPCEMNNEEESDNLLCAYEICPNQCHVYYDCIYYNKIFCQEKDIIEANIKGNFINAAQKELFKLKRILEDRLIPEIKELENEIDKKGRDAVETRHPDLKEIIDNLENIKKEINQWMKKEI